MYDQFVLSCDFLKKLPFDSKIQSHCYYPVLLIHSDHISKGSKILLTCIAYILSKIQNIDLQFGGIIHGKSYRIKRINIKNYIPELLRLFERLEKINDTDFNLNPHCPFCEYSKLCKTKAIKEDNLSLLKGIPLSKIESLNHKGIFTVNQLSYTFRPRRKQVKTKIKLKTRSYELQALALREKKIFISEVPKAFPRGETEMYLDVEAIPENNFYYLIGLLIKEKDQIKKYVFWSNTIEEASQNANRFIEAIVNHSNYVIFHYGNYEVKFLERIKTIVSLKNIAAIDSVLTRCVNLLATIYSNIYFPTYSNGLKEIGEFIDFKWSDKDSSGIESIFWRKKWELTKDDSLKQKIITYNYEDCIVLIKLKDILQAIIENRTSENKKFDAKNITDLKSTQKVTFIINEASIPEMKHINKCSYFDYQMEKVYAKTNKTIRKARKELHKEKKTLYDFKPSKTVKLKASECSNCQSQDLKVIKPIGKKVVDLIFSKIGCRRSIIQYNSFVYSCKYCNSIFYPNNYPTLRLRIGHNLIIWTIFQHIVNKLSFRLIQYNFKEFFHLYLSRTTFFTCKSYFTKYYNEGYEELVKKIQLSEVLYIDETPLNMQFEKGYIWVFTNTREVVSFYKSTREASFLKEFLKNYKGIIVTDFYNGYESIDCLQQKCLIHLIRDFNSDLIRNPFNEEFKEIAKGFTLFLQKIILTIEKHGLKKYFLRKHKKEAEEFIKKISISNYKTEISQQYQNRFRKNKDTLFQFIDHDNVSWNNNNAEHAIKILALHSNKKATSFRGSHIADYLKILSIYQTCEYTNINFLKFLLSKEKSIEAFYTSHSKVRS